MHYQRDYNYSLYKQSPAEGMQIMPKLTYKNQVHLYLPQKIHLPEHQEIRRYQYGPSEYYYQKELHGWDKNCSCGILTCEYRNPIEYQPTLIARNLNVRLPSYMNNLPITSHSSQNNISVYNRLSYSNTSTDDFPLWLKIYSRASVECDHKLHWDMFNIRDLYFFNNVLTKLYELDFEEIVLWYTSYKNALQREIDRHLLKENLQKQMILSYNS